MEIVSNLKKMGLSDGESRTYLACLELGEAGVTAMAQHAMLPRTTVFEHIKSLHQKGLITQYRKKKRKMYRVTNPSLFKEKLFEQHKTLDALLPSLQSLYQSVSNSFDARILEGIEGLHVVRDEILSEADEILWCGNVDDMVIKSPDFFYDFVQRRLQKRIPLRAIFFNDSKIAKVRKGTDAKELKQTKIIEYDEISSLMIIWRDKACLFTLKKGYKIAVIENRELVQMLRAMFEIVWRILPSKPK